MKAPMIRASRIRASAPLLVPAFVSICLLLASLPSLLIAKKVIGFLILPGGLVWLGLMSLAVWPSWPRCGRFFAGLVLVVYTLAGNAWFGGWLLAKLESPYAAISLPAERFDAVCVLGGGSFVTPGGDAQLGPSGDRIVVPAKLFFSGKTRFLVASGLSVTDINGCRSLAKDTAALWMSLGIPDASILRLSEPRTTAEEIRAYKQLIASKSWKRVGVCSSAWHLRRVEKLCRKEGVSMTPVPADFLSAPLPWTPMYAVPQARGFQNVQKALWEYIGGLGAG